MCCWYRSALIVTYFGSIYIYIYIHPAWPSTHPRKRSLGLPAQILMIPRIPLGVLLLWLGIPFPGTSNVQQLVWHQSTVCPKMMVFWMVKIFLLSFPSTKIRGKHGVENQSVRLKENQTKKNRARNGEVRKARKKRGRRACREGARQRLKESRGQHPRALLNLLPLPQRRGNLEPGNPRPPVIHPNPLSLPLRHPKASNPWLESLVFQMMLFLPPQQPTVTPSTAQPTGRPRS